MEHNIGEIIRNPEELEEITKQIFHYFDKDSSGKLDKSELKQALTMVAKDCGTAVPDDEMISELIEALDENGNGQLEIHEFKVLVEELLEAIS